MAWRSLRSAATPLKGHTSAPLVRIYLLVGEPERALDQLEPLLKIHTTFHPAGSRSTPTSPRSGATRASSGW